MVYYRFELAFDGEPQDVGLFTGIDDVGLPHHLELAVLDAFRGLDCPSLDPRCGCFWFTEAGFDRFHYALTYAARAVRSRYWDLLVRRLDTPDKAQWEDENQAVFPLRYLKEAELAEFR